MKKYNFSEVSFTLLYHFRILLLISFTFWSILTNFMGSGKIKKSKMADPRWPSEGRHMTSSAYVADLKGNIFGCIICPPSFVVIALIFSELRGGGRISPPPLPGPRRPKKARSE